MKTASILLLTVAILLTALLTQGQTTGSSPTSRSLGRYSLTTGTIVADDKGTLQPTVFRLDTATGEVEFLVPQPTPNGHGSMLQTWAVTIPGDDFLKMLKPKP